MRYGTITRNEFDQRLEVAIAEFRKIFPDAGYETSCEKANGLWRGKILFSAKANINLMFEQFHGYAALKLSSITASTEYDEYSVTEESWKHGGARDDKELLVKLEKAAIRLSEIFFEDGVSPHFLRGWRVQR